MDAAAASLILMFIAGYCMGFGSGRRTEREIIADKLSAFLED